MKLIVLMSTYNGEKYLREQLDSLIEQELKPNKILIRDDGSKDSTLDILKQYSNKYDYIEYYQGDNIGPAKSFFELINKVSGYDYYSLCDQDDVWLRDKLKVSVEMLNKEEKDKPLLYSSRVNFVDKELNKVKSNVSKLYGYTDFAHSLLYQTAPGCTMVFNEEARKQIIKYDINKEYCIIHDSIIHKVCTMFGKMILDKTPHMLYRQHGGNAIGLPTNKYNQFILRVNRFFKEKNKHYRRDTARSLLNVYGKECSKEYKELLSIVANYEDNKEYKKQLLNKAIFKTNSINDFFFKLLVIANYI